MTARYKLYLLGNKLYKYCHPLYRIAYEIYKNITDKRERILMREILKPNMTVIDVGANIGTFSIYVAKLVPLGNIIAFEPEKRNFDRLCANTKKYSNITPLNLAVGEYDGETNLYISNELNVDHRTFDGGDGRSVMKIPIVSLDSYLGDFKKIDLLKIDVQGYELSVLLGSKNILLNNPDIKILIEFSPFCLKKAGVEPSQLLDFLCALSFDIYPIDDLYGKKFDPSSLSSDEVLDYVNLICVRRLSSEE